MCSSDLGKTSQAAKVFIDRLSGADGQLYDYLADEVFGHLSSQLQAFLIRVSILPTFDQSVAAVAAQTTKAEAGRLLRASERSGLLQRGPSGRGQFRFHPLMRDFLVNRLTQEVSESEIGRTHLLVADATRTTSWRQSVYHLVEGGQPDAAATLLNDELATILARGDFEDPSHIGVHSGPVREAPSPLVLASQIGRAHV